MAVLLMLLAVLTYSWGGAKKEEGGTVYLWMYYPVVVAGCLAQLMDGLVEGFNDPQDIKRF